VTDLEPQQDHAQLPTSRILSISVVSFPSSHQTAGWRELWDIKRFVCTTQSQNSHPIHVVCDASKTLVGCRLRPWGPASSNLSGFGIYRVLTSSKATKNSPHLMIYPARALLSLLVVKNKRWACEKLVTKSEAIPSTFREYGKKRGDP
jgi:hypothetical protein